MLLTFSKSSSPLQWCLRFRHEQAKKWRFFPDPILGKSSWMKEWGSDSYCLTWEHRLLSPGVFLPKFLGRILRALQPAWPPPPWWTPELEASKPGYKQRWSNICFHVLVESFKRFLVAPIHSNLLRLIVILWIKDKRRGQHSKFKYWLSLQSSLVNVRVKVRSGLNWALWSHKVINCCQSSGVE